METPDFRHPKCLATSAISSSFALPSTGGDLMWASHVPSSFCSSRLARELGLTLIWRILNGISDVNNTVKRSVKPSVYETPQIILKRANCLDTRNRRDRYGPLLQQRWRGFHGYGSQRIRCDGGCGFGTVDAGVVFAESLLVETAPRWDNASNRFRVAHRTSL